MIYENDENSLESSFDSAFDSQEFQQISELNFRFQKLGTLVLDEFKLKFLTSLDVSFCELNDRLPACLRNCFNLKELTVGNNSLVSLDVLNGLTQLEKIIAPNNAIKNIDFISNLQHLQEVDVNANKIQNLPFFPGNLKLFYCFGNEITKFEEKVCKNCENLQILMLNNNKIQTIPNKIKKFKNLEKLSLKNNDLIELNRNICLLKNLKVLDVRENQRLKTIPNEIIQKRLNAEIEKKLPDSMQQQFSFQLLTSLPDKIEGYNVYIGDMICAENVEALKLVGVTHVLNVAYGLPNHFEDEFDYLHLPMLDADGEDLLYYVCKSNQFFNSCVGSGVSDDVAFIHCRQGASRSASLLIAFLMRQLCFVEEQQQKQKSDGFYLRALTIVRRSRPLIHPNGSFVRDLHEYDSWLVMNGVEKSDMLLEKHFRKRGRPMIKNDDTKKESSCVVQ